MRKQRITPVEPDLIAEHLLARAIDLLALKAAEEAVALWRSIPDTALPLGRALNTLASCRDRLERHREAVHVALTAAIVWAPVDQDAASATERRRSPSSPSRRPGSAVVSLALERDLAPSLFLRARLDPHPAAALAAAETLPRLSAHAPDPLAELLAAARTRLAEPSR